MKVIHLATAKTWRGGEQQVWNLVNHLSVQGIDQLVVCSKGSVLEERLKEKRINYVSIPKSSGFDLRFAYKLAKVVRRTKGRILHMHDAHAHTAGVLAGAFFGMRIPMVLSRRVDFPVKNNLLSRWKYNYSGIKRILCVSKAIAEITKPSIRESSKVEVVYSGIDVERFKGAENKGIIHRKLNLDDSVSIIGNTAAISDHKDYPTFLQVAKQFLNDRSIHFVVVGDGPLRNEIEEQIVEFGLENKVTLLGFRNDLPMLLPEFDIFLMPSKTEGLGTSLFDAMACKVPIVATRAGGIPEIIKHGQNGLLAEVGNETQLARACAELLEDHKWRMQLVKEASKTLEKYSGKRMAMETLSIYYSVLEAEENR